MYYNNYVKTLSKMFALDNYKSYWSENNIFFTF